MITYHLESYVASRWRKITSLDNVTYECVATRSKKTQKGDGNFAHPLTRRIFVCLHSGLSQIESQSVCLSVEQLFVLTFAASTRYLNQNEFIDCSDHCAGIDLRQQQSLTLPLYSLSLWPYMICATLMAPTAFSALRGRHAPRA